MKRIFAVAVAVTVALSFAACGKSDAAGQEDSTHSSTATDVSDTDRELEPLEDIGENYYKEVGVDDVVFDKESGMQYAKNQLLISCDIGTPRKDVEKICKKIGAEIVGYMEITSDFQIEFKKDMTYDELMAMSEELKEKYDFIRDVFLNTVFSTVLNSNEDWEYGYGDDTVAEVSPEVPEFTDSSMGQIFELMYSVTGKDIYEAMDMVEEFFGTEFADSYTGMETNYIDDPDGERIIHFFCFMKAEKDGIRFNRFVFSCNEYETVFHVEFTNSNYQYMASSYENTDGFKEELCQFYRDVTAELDTCFGKTEPQNPLEDNDDYSASAEYDLGSDRTFGIRYSSVGPGDKETVLEYTDKGAK
ncbi:hypothetical protein [Butyrivibrio sp. AE2032]|uniref:hypothetical protein n=1 Tax=Butyrivibrio sp. AE2032 TaxID=1458463 RepID=UPI00055680B5|nr:hypothetical protein [Butyrivibrio sp. AE2032]